MALNFNLCLDVVLTIKVMSTIALHSTLNISETVGSKGPLIGNGIWGFKWSRDR